MRPCFRNLCVLACFIPALTWAAIPKKASVILLPAKAQEFSDTLAYPGRVHSRINDVMTSEIDGKIIKIEKLLGSKIKKGDVVLTMQNTDPVYRYAPIKIRSLSSGYLTSLDVNLMQKVQRNDKLFTVTDPANLLVAAEIPARDLSALQVGMHGDFRLDPTSSNTIPVEIEGLSPLVDVTSGTATAELRPLKQIDLLRQGQLGQVSLHTGDRKAYVLPESAIIYRDDKAYVRVVESGKVQKHQIEIGRRVGDSFEITKGLKDGDQIVARASRFVADGEEVEVQKSEAN